MGGEVEIETLISEMRSFGVGPDTHFFNALISGYGNQGLVHLAFQVIAAYLFGDKPQVEKAMRLLQGVRASNIMVAYKTLSDLRTVCWMANKVEYAGLLFQDMKAANCTIDTTVWVTNLVTLPTRKLILLFTRHQPSLNIIHRR